jgi:hypothetical protein
VDGGLEASRIAQRLLVRHDHETIESVNGRLVYVRRDEVVTKEIESAVSRVLIPASAGKPGAPWEPLGGRRWRALTRTRRTDADPNGLLRLSRLDDDRNTSHLRY